MDIRGQYEHLLDDVKRAVCEVIDSGRFILGPNVRALEEQVAAAVCARHAVAVGNGTDALILALEALGVGDEVVVVERGDVLRAKPAPDLFLNCQQRLGAAVEECYVVGDAVWDLLAARRARMLCIALLSGGYGEDELTRAGAFRVYRDPAELHASLDELGVVL
jgi:HAD superfamily hydrolase (TIGR01509 family)